MKESSGWTWRLRIGVVAALILSVMGTVSNEQVAHARCVDVANDVWGTLYDFNSNSIAFEVGQSAYTCNLNNIYAGQVYDAMNNGDCAYAIFEDVGYWGEQARSCGFYWVAYAFYDTNGDYYSELILGSDIFSNRWGVCCY